MYLDVIGWLNSLYTIVSLSLFPTNSYVIRKKKTCHVSILLSRVRDKRAGKMHARL